MKTLSAAEARTRFGEIAELVQTEPLRVTRKGRPVFVVLSEKQYENLAETNQLDDASGSDRPKLIDRVRARFSEFEERNEVPMPERQPLGQPRVNFGSSE